MDGVTLYRLREAGIRAEGMGLGGTADRLGILRKEIANFKGLAENERDIKANWALAKIEDTKKTLIAEAAEAKRANAHIGHDHRSLAFSRLAQFGSLALITRLGADMMAAMSHDPSLSMSDVALAAGAIFAACALSWKVLGMLASGSSFESGMRQIESAIGRARERLEGRDS